MKISLAVLEMLHRTDTVATICIHAPFRHERDKNYHKRHTQTHYSEKYLQVNKA
jgi:hypothetical protein